jgi:hypothetical protein
MTTEQIMIDILCDRLSMFECEDATSPCPEGIRELDCRGCPHHTYEWRRWASEIAELEERYLKRV